MAAFATNLLFTLLVLTTVVPAILVVMTLNIVRAACWLLVSLSGAAGLFFFMGADFVGATQLLIYVGGTLVLVIFGVMLTATGPFVNLAARTGDWGLAIFAGAVLFALLAFGLSQSNWAEGRYLVEKDENLRPTTHRIGLALLGFPETPTVVRPRTASGPVAPPPNVAPPGYLFPFEIVSVHLLVVLLGAAYLARAKRRRLRTEGS